MIFQGIAIKKAVHPTIRHKQLLKRIYYDAATYL